MFRFWRLYCKKLVLPFTGKLLPVRDVKETGIEESVEQVVTPPPALLPPHNLQAPAKCSLTRKEHSAEDVNPTKKQLFSPPSQTQQSEQLGTCNSDALPPKSQGYKQKEDELFDRLFS